MVHEVWSSELHTAVRLTKSWWIFFWTKAWCVRCSTLTNWGPARWSPTRVPEFWVFQNVPHWYHFLFIYLSCKYKPQTKSIAFIVSGGLKQLTNPYWIHLNQSAPGWYANVTLKVLVMENWRNHQIANHRHHRRHLVNIPRYLMYSIKNVDYKYLITVVPRVNVAPRVFKVLQVFHIQHVPYSHQEDPSVRSRIAASTLPAPHLNIAPHLVAILSIIHHVIHQIGVMHQDMPSLVVATCPTSASFKVAHHRHQNQRKGSPSKRGPVYRHHQSQL